MLLLRSLQCLPESRSPQVEEQPGGSGIPWLARCPHAQGLAIPERRSILEAMLSFQPIGHQHVLLKAIYSKDLQTSCRLLVGCASTTRSSDASAARVSSLDFFLSSSQTFTTVGQTDSGRWSGSRASASLSAGLQLLAPPGKVKELQHSVVCVVLRRRFPVPPLRSRQDKAYFNHCAVLQT